ncbi:MAG: hypothetical protein CM15mP103_00180 [Gammaproteobacteria bacterium]|nr:MAG: hypothetical protein CM15mP103_00180 [Gammaproteobacteria bacterium]
MVRQQTTATRRYACYSIVQSVSLLFLFSSKIVSIMMSQEAANQCRFVQPVTRHARAFHLHQRLYLTKRIRSQTPCGKLRTAELKCETFAGFIIWVNMDPDCGPLSGTTWDRSRRAAGQRGSILWQRTMANTMWLALQLEGGVGIISTSLRPRTHRAHGCHPHHRPSAPR